METITIKNKTYSVVEKNTHYLVFSNGNLLGDIAKANVTGTKTIDVLRAFSSAKVKGCKNILGAGCIYLKGVLNPKFGTENLEANKANRVR